MSSIALIPARGGSKRIPGKNVRDLAGHPLIAYTIAAAKESGCFEKVLVSSDDTNTLAIAAFYGADCLRRPEEYATSTSPDIQWVSHALNVAGGYDVFSILRPTSPFRTAGTIRRAFTRWNDANAAWGRYSSLRAVEKVSQHPGKMWHVRGNELVPFTLQPAHPFHDSQMASLPGIYVQNASLEIAWVGTVEDTGTISGSRLLPFFTDEAEGFDLNTEYDWEIAERKVRSGEWQLARI